MRKFDRPVAHVPRLGGLDNGAHSVASIVISGNLFVLPELTQVRAGHLMGQIWGANGADGKGLERTEKDSTA